MTNTAKESILYVTLRNYGCDIWCVVPVCPCLVIWWIMHSPRCLLAICAGLHYNTHHAYLLMFVHPPVLNGQVQDVHEEAGGFGGDDADTKTTKHRTQPRKQY